MWRISQAVIGVNIPGVKNIPFGLFPKVSSYWQSVAVGCYFLPAKVDCDQNTSVKIEGRFKDFK